MEFSRALLGAALSVGFVTAAFPAEDPLKLLPIGANELRVITPTLLELCLITTKDPDPAKPRDWNFVDDSGQCRLPPPGSFQVSSAGRSVAVKRVGFRRYVTYAPIKQRDLRIGAYLYLELAAPLTEAQPVEVKTSDAKLWPGRTTFAAPVDPLRWSPALHVNQTGYLVSGPKKGMVGYYLGNLGELDFEHGGGTEQGAPGAGDDAKNEADQPSASTILLRTQIPFQVVDARSGKEAFAGTLSRRPDKGFPVPSYRRVLEADFSALKNPGQYRLVVPGLGASFDFSINDAAAAAFARDYALGIYHQRCGTSNALPFTRFVHAPCHVAPAEVPDMSAKFKSVNESLAKESANFKDNARHTAPQLKSVAACLYPFVRRGPVDVSGGHHDAGDYSKYTINSAAFIHFLVFAADAFPGVADLDNLGLPESGDGKSDVLQEAKWEADFLAKMQDEDGGFYFLVYPRDREYELDVLPDKGDPQVVFPKTTSVTAAAVAALAQCSSSPAFKRQFPEAAAMYYEKAKKGWAFLERAIAKYGKDGAYQKITHYGDYWMHDDELAWAACEMFLASRDPAYHRKVIEWLNPSDPSTRQWGWWRLFDAYGCAIRSYAFGARTGRVKPGDLKMLLVEACEAEIAAAGEDQLRRARDNAYGTSFPEETKRTLGAGWYFSSDAAFDLAVACQLDYPAKRDLRGAMREAIISNLNYEQGCNPVNVTYLTGLGSKRQREIVHQYALNDRRVLPPSGIPLGNIQGGFGWNFLYQKELDLLAFPPGGAQVSPYPLYDRWGDGFNLSQEFVIVNQARALAYLCWLMAGTPYKTQPWKQARGQIEGLPSQFPAKSSTTLRLSCADLDLSDARTVWEASDQQPVFGGSLVIPAGKPLHWVEAEAQSSDGRRVFGVWNAGDQH